MQLKRDELRDFDPVVKKIAQAETRIEELGMEAKRLKGQLDKEGSEIPAVEWAVK